MKRYLPTLLFLALAALVASFFFVGCNGIVVHDIEGRIEGPRTVVIASTHGNEPAGFYAIHRFLSKDPSIDRGSVTFVPSANPCGLAANRRKHPLGDFDVNRSYPNKTYLNSKIRKLVDRSDWVVDLHEGWGFRRIDPRSVGSGVYPGASVEARRMSSRLIDSINETIEDPIKKFSTASLGPVEGSLRDYCNLARKNYLLIETSGIRDIQPIDLRSRQHEFMLERIIDTIHGLSDRKPIS